MDDVIGALGGFRGIRADLLVALKKTQPLTAGELGDQFGLTANALRRHLRALEDDGLVVHQREIRGVGAPVYTFSLTAAGEALFPRGYVAPFVTALEHLRAYGGDEAVERALGEHWQELGDRAEPVVRTLPLTERVALVAELLTSKGYMAEAIETTAPGEEQVLVIRMYHCPIREIAERFPEACAAEAAFVQRLLGVPLMRGACRLHGCGRCEYGVLAVHEMTGTMA